MSTTNSSSLSLAEARKIVKDLFQPKAWIYWTDFMVTWALGMVCYSITRGAPMMTRVDLNLSQISFKRVLFFFITGFLFYRLVLFTHELVHLPHGKFKGFRVIWNALCGIPFLIPSFTYYTHNSHHRRSHYGTDEDGEYLPMSHRRPWYILFYLSWNLVLPPLVVLRFGLLTPLTWISPSFRNYIHSRMSSMVMDPSYIRPMPTKSDLKVIRLQEVLCFLWIWTLGIASVIIAKGVPSFLLVQIYSTAVLVTTINSIRTLGAHHYYNKSGEMTFEEQLLDSINFPRRWMITELWGPVGTRYHALHHLFPTLPYHAMTQAHKRLMEHLPEDSPYRQTESVTLTGELWSLWRRASRRQSDKQSAVDSSEHQTAT